MTSSRTRLRRVFVWGLRCSRGPLTCLLLLVVFPAIACTQRQTTPVEKLSEKYAVREEAVRFASGKVNLAGTLVLPGSPGAHPAVVLFHGSGRQARDLFSNPDGEWYRILEGTLSSLLTLQGDAMEKLVLDPRGSMYEVQVRTQSGKTMKHMFENKMPPNAAARVLAKDLATKTEETDLTKSEG